MTARSASPATESPSALLRRLEVTLIWLWSTEPERPLEQRQALLARLNHVSSRVDLLGLRHGATPDTSIDAEELRLCALELDALGESWVDPSEEQPEGEVT